MESVLALTIILSLILQVFIPGFPKETLLLQAGISYGVLLGGVINWLGMVIGAQVAFELTRKLVMVGSKHTLVFNNYMHNRWIMRLQQQGNLGLFFMRLVPYAPNDILSLVSGVLILPRRGFLLVSILTAIPYAFAFSYLGYFGSKLLGEETIITINYIVMGASLLIILIFQASQYLRKSKENENEADFQASLEQQESESILFENRVE